MKRAMMIIVTGLLLSTVAISAFAGGGKNHGEKGQGAVEQQPWERPGGRMVYYLNHADHHDRARAN
jgi:hypothetical protein